MISNKHLDNLVETKMVGTWKGFNEEGQRIEVKEWRKCVSDSDLRAKYVEDTINMLESELDKGNIKVINDDILLRAFCYTVISLENPEAIPSGTPLFDFEVSDYKTLFWKADLEEGKYKEYIRSDENN